MKHKKGVKPPKPRVEVRRTRRSRYELRRYPYAVWVVNGVQSFRFDFEGTKRECEWYKRMLKKAGVG